uniref:Uncharacterized protein n=1 Tax=Eutreptiella gymnastica TaxID=73025 RepID=A0A7S4CVP0_9EUGL
MALGCPTCGELQLLSDLPSAGSGCRPSRWIIATSGLVLFLVELGYVVSEKGPPPWSMLTATLKPHTAPRAMIPPASARRRPHRASQMQTPKPKAMAMHPSLPVLIEAKPSAPTAGALPPTLAWAMWLGLLLSGAAAWWWYWWRWGRSQETWVTLMTMGSEEGELSEMTTEEAIRRYLGVDMQTLILKYPAVQRYSVARVKEIAKCLTEFGVDVKRVVKREPRVVGFDPCRMRKTIAYLEELGLKVPKVVDGHPAVFGYSLQKMKGTVAYLESLGVNVPYVMNWHPAVFGLSLGNMKGTVAYLEELQVNIATVVNRRPEVFGISMENMKRTVTSLEKLGVDAPTVINTLPSIFGLRMETNVCPKIHFVTERMGRSVAEINRFPPYLGYSLQQRILPRYEFLVHCRGDANGVALASMLTPADEVFARRVAGSTLEEYQRWKAESWDQDLYVSEGSAVLEE